MNQPSTIYVCNVMGNVLYPLEDIDKESVKLHDKLNGQWELSFTYRKAKDVASPAFDCLEEGMYLLLDDTGFFKMRQPSLRIDAATESKEIQAFSCDVELEDKVVTLPINMGVETSLEYLLNNGEQQLPFTWQDAEGVEHEETELLRDPYLMQPYDWIVLYNTYSRQLTEFLAWYQPWAAEQTADEEQRITIHKDDEGFDKCLAIITQIPRLVQRSIYLEGAGDATTVQDVTDTKMIDYEYRQFLYQTENDDGDVTAISFCSDFLDRVYMLIGFYDTYGKRLSLLDILCEQTNYAWAVGDIYGLDADPVDYSLANSRMQFDIDESIYSFLVTTYAQWSKRLVTFDILRRRINVTPVEAIGEDTGIVFSYDQLLNTLNVAADEDTLATRLTIKGGDDLSIEQVNFGEDTVIDIDYKLNARDRNGRRIYVSDALAEKYARFKEVRDQLRENEDGESGYINLTKERNRINQEIYELKYRVPADSLHEDWDTYTENEIVAALKEYSNKLHTLEELYANDYGRAYSSETLPVEQLPWVNTGSDKNYNKPDWIALDKNELIFPRTEFIIRTPYWWDYVAYNQTITQIRAAMQARYMSTPAFKFKGITENAEDPNIQELYKKITAWETEWTLYGSIELGNKISAYDTQMQAMIDANSIQVEHYAWDDLALKAYKRVTPASGANPKALKWLEQLDAANDTYQLSEDASVDNSKTYYTSLQTCFADTTGANFEAACDVIKKKHMWGALTTDEQNLFTDEEAYMALLDANIVTRKAIPWANLTDAQRQACGNLEANYFYNAYVEIYNHRMDAQEYLDSVLNVEIAALEAELQTVQDARNTLADTVRLATYINPTEGDYYGESFDDYELKVLNLLMRDAEYTNEYIFTTALHDTVEAVDKMKELYEDAIEQVRTFSRPQLTFTADVDNLLALPEFESWHSQFKLGNYLYVEYRDGTYVRIRMIGRTYNPCLIDAGGLSVEFSNITYTKTKVSDVESVLGMANATTSSGGGSSGGGNGAADWEELFSLLSTSMIKRLLSPEGFVKEVTEVVANKVVNRSVTPREKIYESLWNGIADISGDCLKAGVIRSVEVNGQGRPISWLDLDEGGFNFGDGALMFTFQREEDGSISRDIYGDPKGLLSLKGQVQADSGHIGGVQIGDPNIMPGDQDAEEEALAYADRLFIGKNGFFFMDVDDTTGYINNNFSAGISAGDYGEVQIQAWRYCDNPSRNMMDDMTAHLSSTLDHNGLHIGGATWNSSTGTKTADRYVDIDSANGILRVMSSSNPTVLSDYDRYVLLHSDGTIQATGAITCGSGSFAGNAVVQSSTNQSSGTATGSAKITASTRQQGSGNFTTTLSISGSAIVPKESDNNNSANHSFKAQYNTDTYAAIYSNGNIWATNCIRGGQVYSQSTQLGGADYAELFEWLDGNSDGDDRRGRFVTTVGDKIQLASASDDYILGVVSATPSVVGDTAFEEWHGKYLRDEFGEIIYQFIEHPAVLDADGRVVTEAYLEGTALINPEYDESLEYIPREQRNEWTAVGMVGKLVVLDDGTCEVNGFATSADEGIATKADGMTNYRVIKRIDGNHIMVAAK